MAQRASLVEIILRSILILAFLLGNTLPARAAPYTCDTQPETFSQQAPQTTTETLKPEPSLTPAKTSPPPKTPTDIPTPALTTETPPPTPSPEPTDLSSDAPGIDLLKAPTNQPTLSLSASPVQLQGWMPSWAPAQPARIMVQ